MRKHRIGYSVLLIFIVLTSAFCLFPFNAPATGARDLAADINFTCKWWSEADMDGMNPNAPPPKTTEVKLTKWEYSDPIGVPHPDVVDIAITLKNGGSSPLSDLEVEVAGKWMIGTLRDASHAKWSDVTVLKQFKGAKVGPGETITLRIPVNLQSKMKALEAQRKWPYSLRILATARFPETTAALASTEKDLPIKPGD